MNLGEKSSFSVLPQTPGIPLEDSSCLLEVLIRIRMRNEVYLTKMGSEGAFDLTRIIQVIEFINFIRILSFGWVIFLGISYSGCT